jgi:hypothetical protein
MHTETLMNAAASTRRAHYVVAAAVVLIAAAASFALGSPWVVLVAAFLAAGIASWGRSWYGDNATLAVPAGQGVVVSSRSTMGVLTEATLDTGNGEVRLLSWSATRPVVGESVALYGSPFRGSFAAVSTRSAWLNAVPGGSGADNGVTRPTSPKLNGGDGPALDGPGRRR